MAKLSDLLRRLFPLNVFLLLFVVVVILNCTAYFNTYYNAETAFREAQTSHQKLLKDNPDSLIVTPPTDAVGKYDRTIEKSIKVIETFPKKKKWHDDALFLMGKAYFFKREMLKAVRRFRQLEQEFPASPFLPQAYLYLCKAYIEEGNLDKAEEVLLQAEKRYPNLNDNHQITLLMIMIAIRREGKSQAIQLLEEMARSIKSEDLRIDLLMRTAELYIDLKQYDKAIVILRKAPRRKDFVLQSYRLDRALLTCYKAIDSLETAFALINSMIALKRYEDYSDEMLFEKGRILYAMGNIAEAVKVYRKLTAGVDSASVAGDTSSFKARALLELALIFQKDREDYTKSHEYLKLASSVRDTGTNRVAKVRLNAMDRLIKLREETDLQDSLSGQRRFSIGELFRFELEEPDSAFRQFISISTDTLIDSAMIPKALCQAALIARHELHDTLRGDSLFTDIVRRYPSTEYGKIAQRELRMPVTILTREDSALLAFRNAERVFYEENDVKGAIRAFFELSKEFSDLPIAPKSLFAAAWFSDNVLLKKQTAKSLYEKICAKYPETEYCTGQAKPRLKIVVDTLEKLDRLRQEHEKQQLSAKSSRKTVKNKSATGEPSTVDSTAAPPRQTDDDASEPLSTEELSDESASSPQKGAGASPVETPVATPPPSGPEKKATALPASGNTGDTLP